MLERLKLIFSKSEPETSASLLLAREELEGARVAAVEELRRAQMKKNSLLVEAVASGDTKTRAAVRKSLAELQAEVDELTGALALYPCCWQGQHFNYALPAGGVVTFKWN